MKKILIVDDERDFAELLKMNCEKNGDYVVRIVTHGSEGIRAARGFKPDVILLDLLLPGMRGEEIARLIRQDEQLKGTPVIFLTAFLQDEERQEARRALYGYRVLSKLMPLQEILTNIEEAAAGR